MTSPFLLIADHASNHVPEDIHLGLDPALLNTHIALDIGVAELGAVICERLGCPGIYGDVSRLVIDLNREDDTPGLIPLASDGRVIPGNAGVDAAARISRFYQPYHTRIAAQIAAQRPQLLISLHSFTPQLACNPQELRPWQIGILYNEDDRAAQAALAALTTAGVIVGDNLPYSGKVLNATMNRHAEANGIPYLGLEVRQDLIGDPAGIVHWADVLEPVIRACVTRF
ncbi:MAG: N-formylglutamate amidohydrolase [Alphaproteobacteria bacterium]|nr:N-formylglutamate amidohydrolase [Alphaproteobacteria bacterium]MDE2042387.1 N-formylglutamate amidohydrolase [Alphaproteobacteria bacterium]MDE2340616.1 N-formylglutamate amidohydrolase [Alphaproteobacteria bacterium]